MKRFAMILCALILLFAMVPGMGSSAFAAEEQQADGGPVANLYPINSVAVTVDEPVAGARPDTSITVVTDPEGCLIQSEFSVSWYEATNTAL